MATYSNNTTIKISAAVAATVSTSGTATLYTCPANSYAILNVSLHMTNANGAQFALRVGGYDVLYGTNSSGFWYTSNYNKTAATDAVANANSGLYPIYAYGIYVGPSQVVQVFSSLYPGIGYASGVSFINTP